MMASDPLLLAAKVTSALPAMASDFAYKNKFLMLARRKLEKELAINHEVIIEKIDGEYRTVTIKT